MSRMNCSIIVLCLFFSGLSSRAIAAERHTGPWDMAKLKQSPQAEFGAKNGLVQEVYYEGEPFGGKPTRVFAYYAKPDGDGPFPAMLCVHGGGGQAFKEWAELWAKRGYVALAMDTAGQGPNEGTKRVRLADGGPDQSDTGKFGDFTLDTVKEMWTYHAVAAVVRGHSLLAAQKEVDRDRIGITGISWGGYLTCIVAGIDDRLKCAVPVYGCGFLGDNSTWVPRFAKMSAAQRKLWLDQFDPSRYLPGATCPMLFVNGTNDFAYPLDSYQKSYRLPQGPVTLCIRVRMPHGHQQGWAPEEIGLFVDGILKEGVPLAKISAIEFGDGLATAKFTSRTEIKTGELHYAVDRGPWQEREWKSIPATVERGTVRAHVPHARPLVYYLTITDDRDALVSTPHAQLEP